MNSSLKWGSYQAGRRWSTFTRSKTWKRFSSHRKNLRTVMIAEPELGDRIMRALILRRVVMIETGAGGPVLIGPEDAPDVVRLQGFLSRNAYPYQVLDSAVDRDAADLVEKYAPIRRTSR